LNSPSYARASAAKKPIRLKTFSIFPKKEGVGPDFRARKFFDPFWIGFVLIIIDFLMLLFVVI